MKQGDKTVAYISIAMKRSLDQDLMREVFDLGGSIIDAGIIYCENNQTRKDIERMLDKRKVEYKGVDYTDRGIIKDAEDPGIAAMLMSLSIEKVYPY
jgi:hypothetical protein